ncbi:magnesium transporter [Rhodobacteraceae bacterium NNCM2]|nr:magnesium transporter [Coraliihabitans acroporae]
MSENLTPENAEDPGAERREDEFALDHELVVSICDAVEAGDRKTALTLLEDLHAADIADLMEQITTSQRKAMVEMLWSDLDTDVIVELDEGIRDEVLEILNPTELAETARELEPDDLVYLLDELEGDQKEAVLQALDPVERAAVVKSLEYPEYSAGRLMQTDFVKAPPFWTVGQMIDMLRADDDLPEQFYDIVVVDPAVRPIGTIPLSAILGNRRPVTLDSLMTEDFRTLHVEDEQEDVAYAFNQYHLVSAPVVDDDGRVVGVITIDDAMEVLDEEAEEDIKRLGGVGDEELSDQVLEITRRRFPWLVANLVTAVFASLVIAQFDATIGQIVALAVLMPIVASMGGNAGTQTLTVAVRALATRDLTPTNAARIVGREAIVGLINGILFALMVGGIAWVWFASAPLGIVIAIAMVGNMIVAGLAGILIPMGLDKLGADPALASGTFVTTVTDVFGFFAFLGLAGLVLL